MRFKAFSIFFALSLPFWLAVNNFNSGIEDFVIFRQTGANQKMLGTVAASFLENTGPEPEIKEDLNLDARAVISVFIDGSGNKKILFEKNGSQPFPIASITKLMMAHVILEYYDINKTVSVSQAAIWQGAEFEKFKAGDKFVIKDLLSSVLMESSNDAVLVLAEEIGENSLVDIMNFEAENILGGNNKTFFANATGLDPSDSGGGAINQSSVRDLAEIGAYLFKKQPLILQITSTTEVSLYQSERSFGREIFNTNKLLAIIPGILGGKTGETQKAKGCLLLIMKSPDGKGILINVILGSDDRFGEMEKMIKWTADNYRWQEI